MKIRTGYVSNSSSSSFVVAFDKIPKTHKQLRNMLFPDKKQDMVKFYDFGFSVDEVIQQVFKDIKSQCSLSEDDGFYDIDEENIYEEIEDFKKVQPEDKICLQFRYADDDGDFFSVMEHSGIFNNMPHLRVSHH